MTCLPYLGSCVISFPLLQQCSERMGRVPREFKPGNEAGLMSCSVRAVGWGKSKSELREKARKPMSSVRA